MKIYLLKKKIQTNRIDYYYYMINNEILEQHINSIKNIEN